MERWQIGREERTMNKLTRRLSTGMMVATLLAAPISAWAQTIGGVVEEGSGLFFTFDAETDTLFATQ